MCIFSPVSGRTDNFKQLFVSYIIKEGMTPKHAVPIACHSWQNSSEPSDEFLKCLEFTLMENEAWELSMLSGIHIK